VERRQASIASGVALALVLGGALAVVARPAPAPPPAAGAFAAVDDPARAPVRNAAPPAASRAPALPVTFERNVGQADRRVRFVARGPDGLLLLSAGEATLFPARAGASSLRMRLAGAGRRAAPHGARRRSAGTNYLVGDDPARWRRGVPTYDEVRYRGVYPGVDLRYHGGGGGLEYDFELAPGADPGAIAIDMLGARRLRVDARGDLRATLAGRTVVQRAPRVYQRVEGARRPLRGRFVLLGPRRVGFALGAYDRTRPLVIDPTIAFSGTLGGAGADAARAIAVDGGSSMYVTGETTSLDFPRVGAPRRAPRRVQTAAFVAKLDPDGRVLYSTVLGGSRFSAGHGIAVDDAGRAYVTGATNATDFPTTGAALQRSYGGGPFDAFVTALDATGRQLRYSTFLGDTHYDEGNAIALDSAGRAVIAGRTVSPHFPRKGGLLPPVDGGAFVTKLARSGSALVFSAVFGGDDRGNHGNTAFGVAVDGQDSTYATGVTNAASFPTAGPLQGTLAGGGDAFVVKIGPAGRKVVYSTYLGGGADDSGRAIAADAEGNAYVTGVTSSSDFPRRGRQVATGGAGDAFVAKLEPDGRTLGYATRLGGSDDDGGFSIATDAEGSAYVTGATGSPDFPLVQPVARSGGAFVSALAPDGASLRFSTRLGGDATGAGLGIAVDRSGAVAIAGQSGSTPGGDALVTVLAP
jgi:hypothetical protein